MNSDRSTQVVLVVRPGCVKPRYYRWPVFSGRNEVIAMTSFETLYVMLMMLHIVVILLIEINRSK